MKISLSGISPRGVYVGLGVFSLALVGAMGHVMLIGATVGDTYVPLVRAAEEIKLDATLAHLWFEEILSGDRHESIDEVWARLEATRRNVRAMVEGGGDRRDIVPLDDPLLRATARQAEAKLSEFEAITAERWKARQTSVSGTRIDQTYDAVFREFIALADEMKLELHEVIRRETRAARRAQWTVIAGAVGLLSIFGFLFARYTRQRRTVEESLRLKVAAEEEARRHLEKLAHIVRLTTMSELVAGIAHEINQPLAALSTSAAACRRLVDSGRAHSPEHLSALQLIEGEASRASDVVTRLWAFVAKRDSRYEVVDINGLLKQVVKLGELDPQMRETVVRLEPAADLPPVEADAVQIQQVVLNLLRNGCEAMEGCNGENKAMTIRTRVDEKGEIEVSIVDRGSGVSDEIAGETFDPFFTTKKSGMGMGLSISHSIITAHGGRIWFRHNKPERGTTFLFTLPAAAGRGS
ncbi:MAG: ATP-binding protein [Thermoleophilia bacterium]|nr:ATP-binding protein [Thermoleophilia bacterium]